MNPLRSLAQFIAFLHNQSLTNKTSMGYQFLHFTILIGFFFVATGIYLKHFGYSLQVNEKNAVFILISGVFVGSGYLLFFGKRPYLKSEYKNWQVVIGGVIWLLLWIYIVSSLLLLED